MSVGTIHRQGACPCGSKAAATACCLPWEETYQGLMARALAFLEQAQTRRELEAARELFWGAEDPTSAAGSADAELRLLEWFLHDAAPRDGRGTFLGEFADQVNATPLETAVLLGMLLAPVRAYEVAESPTPRGVNVKDLLSGAECGLLPFGVVRAPIRSDILVCRLVPFGRANRVGAGVLRLPAGCREELSAYLRMAYQVSRAPRHVSLEDFLDGSPHLYHHFFLAHGVSAGADAWQTVRAAVFAEGCLAYRVRDAARLRATLTRQPEIESEAGGSGEEERFCWIDPQWGTVRADLALSGFELTVRTRCRPDLAAASEFLGRILQGLVESCPAGPPPVAPPKPVRPAGPRGGQFLRRAIVAWPDTPRTVLAGQTPRQAVLQRGLQRTVASLLADLERDLGRQKRLDRAWVDVSGLWEVLGIADLAPAHAVGRIVRPEAPRPPRRAGVRRKGPGPRSVGRRFHR